MLVVEQAVVVAAVAVGVAYFASLKDHKHKINLLKILILTKRIKNLLVVECNLLDYSKQRRQVMRRID